MDILILLVVLSCDFDVFLTQTIQGYEPMFSYNWPGTMNACNCKLWDEDA